MSKIQMLLCAFSLVIGSPAALAAWSVQKTTGDVAIASPGATPVSLGSRTELADGTTITTGPSGRAFLVRNKETMVVGPNSVITIPGDAANGFTRIMESAGSVEFDVERRNVKHFQVDTPFLAALVKGTHFVVTVESLGASVSVSRGKVGVTDTHRGGSVDILAGQTAKVSTTASLSVSGVVDNSAIEAEAARQASLDDEGKDKNKGQDEDHNAVDNNGSDNSGQDSGNGGSSGGGGDNSGPDNSGNGNSGRGSSGGSGSSGGKGKG